MLCYVIIITIMMMEVFSKLKADTLVFVVDGSSAREEELVVVGIIVVRLTRLLSKFSVVVSESTSL